MKALFLAVTLLALPARAELVEVDLNTPGDALVTRDTDTGLDWLDLGGVTTNLSYDAIQGGAGGWIAGGWRYATGDEVCHLFTAHGGAAPCNMAETVIASAPAGAIDVLERLGVTETAPGPFPVQYARLQGFYEDGTGGTGAGFGMLEVGGTLPPGFLWSLESVVLPDHVLAGEASAARGSFLVRATPPAVPVLPPAGVAGLAALLALVARRRPR